jgi:hypothetical protein
VFRTAREGRLIVTSEGLGRSLDLESEVHAPIRNTAIERESMKKATREGGFALQPIYYASASRPCFSTTERSLSAIPLGCFAPVSHFSIVDSLVFR